MFQVKLRDLLQRIENEGGQKVSLSELSEATGIHRNLLSKLYSSPAHYTSTRYIDALLTFAFEKLREKDPDKDIFNKNWELSDRDLMNSLMTTLIGIFPMNPGYWSFLDQHRGGTVIEGRRSMFSVPTEVLWDLLEKAHPSVKELWKDFQNSGKLFSKQKIKFARAGEADELEIPEAKKTKNKKSTK